MATDSKRVSKVVKRADVPAPSRTGTVSTMANSVRVAKPKIMISDFSMVTPPVFDIPAMISQEEKNYYYWLTSNHAPGVGAVVECGTWLGASTAYLAAGLNGRPIHCFDGFVWADDYNKKSAIKLKNGDDFSELFKENMSSRGINVIIHKGMIHEFAWDGSPIELLVLDMGKRARLLVDILKVFGPALIPGQTRIVLQDYQYFAGAPILLVLDAVRDSTALEHITISEGRRQPNAVSFLVTSPLDMAVLEEAADHKTWSVDRIRQAWDRAMAPLPPQTRARMAPGLAFLFFDANHHQEAVRALSEVEMDHTMLRRFMRLGGTSFAPNYEPLFSLVVPGWKRPERARRVAATPSQVAAAPIDDATLYRVQATTDALLGLAELKALYNAARAAPAGVYVEIGPAQGGSTVAIGLGRKSAERVERLYTADVFTASNALKSIDVDTNVDVLKSNLKTFGVHDNVEIIVVPGQDPATVIRASAEIGFLFIDADGALDRDFAALYDRVVPNGTIVLDDCENVKSEKYVAFEEGRLKRYIASKRVKTIAELTPFEKEYSVYRFAETLKVLGLVEQSHVIGKTVFLKKVGGKTYAESGAPEAMAETRAAIGKAFAVRRAKFLRSGEAPAPEPAPTDRLARGRPSKHPSVFATREPRGAGFVLNVIRQHAFDHLTEFRPTVRFAQAGLGQDPNESPFIAYVLNKRWRGLFIDPDPDILAAMRARIGERTGSKFVTALSPAPTSGEAPVTSIAGILREDLIIRPHVLWLDAVAANELAAKPSDFVTYKPDIIAFQHPHLTTRASLELRKALIAQGYAFVADNREALALSVTRFDAHFLRFAENAMGAARATGRVDETPQSQPETPITN